MRVPTANELDFRDTVQQIKDVNELIKYEFGHLNYSPFKCLWPGFKCSPHANIHRMHEIECGLCSECEWRIPPHKCIAAQLCTVKFPGTHVIGYSANVENSYRNRWIVSLSLVRVGNWINYNADGKIMIKSMSISIWHEWRRPKLILSRRTFGYDPIKSWRQVSKLVYHFNELFQFPSTQSRLMNLFDKNMGPLFAVER